MIANLGAAVEAERVLEAAAAAALDRDAQDLGLAGRLLRHDRRHLGGGTLGQGDERRLGLLDGGHGDSVPGGAGDGTS